MFLRIEQDFAKLEDSWNKCNYISSPASWSKQHQLLAETKSLPSKILKTFKNGGPTTLLYSLFQCFTVFMVSRSSFHPTVQTSRFPLPLIIPLCGTSGTRIPFLRSFLQVLEGCPLASPRHCLLQAKQSLCQCPGV